MVADQPKEKHTKTFCKSETHYQSDLLLQKQIQTEIQRKNIIVGKTICIHIFLKQLLLKENQYFL